MRSIVRLHFAISARIRVYVYAEFHIRWVRKKKKVFYLFFCSTNRSYFILHFCSRVVLDIQVDVKRVLSVAPNCFRQIFAGSLELAMHE